ncbi:hypothetical protein [Mucilaginibacter sp.]|uniref:hypothetical protein n=1 Tax=Mucilaginibacter sp. TaxID=1882438 RepID=UPI0025FCEDCB|nr:hypothetical protein [Mucilaginibacter sp.]
MKRVTFITTGQPTTNPRLVKEVETLIMFGYQVKVIYCFYQSWAQKFDHEIIDKNPGVYIFCGGNPVTSKLSYYKTRIRQKISKYLSGFTKLGHVYENAVSRTHAEALSIAKKIQTDIYIAHNLGALPTAVLASKHSNAKVGYDAEDMHSGFGDPESTDSRLNKYIEEKYFAHTDYFTAASPSIAQQYKQLYPYLNPVVINNVFVKNTIPFTSTLLHKSVIKLFWLSQTIGINRGIEDVVNAMHLLNNSKLLNNNTLELHLLGNLPDGDFKVFIENQAPLKIHIHPPVSTVEIEGFASQFDIGLAMETAYCLNNDIALSNKIFTYIQSGLAIIASDTKAQSMFLEQYPGVAKLYKKNDAISMANCLKKYAENPQLLYETRRHNYMLGQNELNWETEREKFIAIVDKTLQEN